MKAVIPFEFVLPTRIVYGEGVSKEISSEIRKLGRNRPFIITDKGLVKARVVDKIVNYLESEGIAYDIFDEIEPNPRDTTVQRAYDLAKKYGSDVIVAIGGGSSMDTAKAVGLLLSHGGRIGDYEGLDKVKNPICDLIAIPTTVGTGSEVTFWSVITDTERHFKMSIGSPLVAPKVALLDPELVENLPASIISSTGMDALTHAIEGYTCTVAEPITDACGIYAIEMIASNIREAVFSDSKEAKANMLLGSLLAGISFGNSDIAGVHCMAEALGGLYDTPHGVANAIILPYVMEYNYVACIDKFARIAKAMGEQVSLLSARDAAYQAVIAVRKLNQDLNIPSLMDIGVKEADLGELAKRSFANVSVGSNPRKITEKDFLNIFKKAYQ